MNRVVSQQVVSQVQFALPIAHRRFFRLCVICGAIFPLPFTISFLTALLLGSTYFDWLDKDPKLAETLKDRPGHGAWVDWWYITRHPGTAGFVNYLHTARTKEAEARTEANFLWADTMTRRDAQAGKEQS